MAYGIAADRELVWTMEAQRLLEVIPSFVRGRVARRVEEHGRKQGYQVITVEVMRQVRKGRGVLALTILSIHVSMWNSRHLPNQRARTKEED